MENASKALIIAGAILLSIAIIGIGMFVYNSVSGTIQDSVDMSDDEINAYNRDFLTYEGNARNGSQVKSLCETVRNHNVTVTDPSQEISLINGTAQNITAPTQTGTAGTTPAEINTLKNTILSGRQYTVSIGYDPSTGRVTQVGVVLNDQ